jgi:hypothetical protein
VLELLDDELELLPHAASPSPSAPIESNAAIPRLSGIRQLLMYRLLASLVVFGFVYLFDRYKNN